MIIIVWKDDEDRVIAFTPPGGMTLQEVLDSDLVPKDRDYFQIDHEDLPKAPITAWRLDAAGDITVDEPTVVKLSVPPTASSGDFMKALLELGWYDDVDAAVQQGTTLQKVLWSRAAIFERYNPLVVGIAQAIGKTDSDLDDLFLLTKTYNP